MRVPAQVLILGWGNARPRQMRIYTRMHTKLGLQPHVYIAPIVQDFVTPALRMRFARTLAVRLIQTQRETPSELVIHSFSDNGFLTLGPLLQALQTLDGGDAVRAALRGVILDSAPGVYAETSAVAFAAALQRGFEPDLLRRLPAALTPLRPWLSRACYMGLVAFARLRPGLVRSMNASADRVSASMPRVPLHFVYSDGDRVIPRAAVEAFADRMHTAGFAVTRTNFGTSTHVGHYVADPALYIEMVSGFVNAVLTDPA